MATIYKRRRVWYVDYTDPRTARRVQRSLGVRTKAAAEAARARVELELVEGRTP
ncbi:MAG: hypothetical protein GTN49_07220, partial [candidate division Zixibacteria bacterium]|nr:hypothetical protein [candidate division Zixibacteria bacterium]